jgi:hypothetical protein
MSTTHGSPADSPFGDELSLTVAQPPASAVPAQTSTRVALATMSGLRMRTSSVGCDVYTAGPPKASSACAQRVRSAQERSDAVQSCAGG